MRRGRGGGRRRAPRLPARESAWPRQPKLQAAALAPGRPTARQPGVLPRRAEAHAVEGQAAGLRLGSASREREPHAPADSPSALQPSSGERDEAGREASSLARPWPAAESWAAVAAEGRPAPGPCGAPPWPGRPEPEAAARAPLSSWPSRLAPCERAPAEAAAEEAVAAMAAVAVEAAASAASGRASAAALDRGSAPWSCRPL
jgi:hypothetical protein